MNFQIIGEEKTQVFLANVFRNIDLIYCLPIDFYGYRYPFHNTYKPMSEKKELDYIKHYRDVFEILNIPDFEKISLDYEEHMYYFLLNQKFHFHSKSILIILNLFLEKIVKFLIITKPNLL